MAAGLLPKPGRRSQGRDVGPCLDPCSHVDCNKTRLDAQMICRFCDNAIGYERRYYKDPQREGRLVHAQCLEESADEATRREAVRAR